MNQRGFLSGPILYLVLGLVGLSVVSGGWAWIQSKRLDLAKTQLADCTIRYEQALASLERQNKAVKDLENRAKETQERAAKALAKAEQGVAATQKEVARLKASKPKPTACPAGDAVQQIRRGLG